MHKHHLKPGARKTLLFLRSFSPALQSKAAAILAVSPHLLFINWKRSRVFFTPIFLCAFAGMVLGANDNSHLFVKRITYNYDQQLDHDSIAQLLGPEHYLDFPPIQKIVFEIGSIIDSLPDTLEYKLAGFENIWNPVTSNIFQFTNLAGREYELRIRGKDVKGRSQRLVFRVAEAKHNNIREEWWFQPLLTFCLLLIPFTIVYFLSLDRSRRHLGLEVVRNQIASDLHDAVGANLGAINNMTDLLKKRHEQQEPAARTKIIDKIKSYTGDTINNLQDTVWAINPLNDSIEELLGKMKEFALLMFSAKEIEVQYDSNYDQQYPINLDMQQRHGMLMMFKEVVNNICKHAAATGVTIDIHNTKTSLSIQVKDDGKGFDTSVLHQGNGLKNFQARAKENFIDLDIQSELGKGTEIKMLIHSLT